MVRYVDMNYSKLKEEYENRGIKKYSGLRKQILMILLIMHNEGMIDKLIVFFCTKFYSNVI